MILWRPGPIYLNILPGETWTSCHSFSRKAVTWRLRTLLQKKPQKTKNQKKPNRIHVRAGNSRIIKLFRLKKTSRIFWVPPFIPELSSPSLLQLLMWAITANRYFVLSSTHTSNLKISVIIVVQVLLNFISEVRWSNSGSVYYSHRGKLNAGLLEVCDSIVPHIHWSQSLRAAFHVGWQ